MLRKFIAKRLLLLIVDLLQIFTTMQRYMYLKVVMKHIILL